VTPTDTLEASPGAFSTTYTVYTKQSVVDSGVFTNTIGSTVFFTALSGDAFCFDQLIVDGTVIFANNIFYDLDCDNSAAYAGLHCYGSRMVSFDWSPPNYASLTAVSAAPPYSPSFAPSTVPPTSQPSAQPSSSPTSPTSAPSAQPSSLPTSPTSQPTVQPSSLPTNVPSARPSSVPTSVPSSHPSSQPSSALTKATVDELLLSSPTYKVRNGFSFAHLVTSSEEGDESGRVVTWGELHYGGNSSLVQAQLQSGVVEVVGSRFAFAVHKADGSMTAWGAPAAIRGVAMFETPPPPPPAAAYNHSITSLVANEVAFAGISSVNGGKVLALGSKQHGGDVLNDKFCSGFSTQLSANVSSLTASAGSFAALKTDGTVYCWGNQHTGAGSTGYSSESNPALVNVMKVVATRDSFAALLRDTGAVITWGSKLGGGDSTQVATELSSDVIHIVATHSAFAAIKKDRSVVTWGYSKRGGDSSAVAGQLLDYVAYIAHTFVAFAALKRDGSVVTWGDARGGGDSTAVSGQLVDIVAIEGNSKAFAALTSGGGVVTWGHSECGGSIPADRADLLSRGVVSITAANRAFAALKADGSVVVWGLAEQGGEAGSAAAFLDADVVSILANDAAFSAIKADGSIVAWGHSTAIATTGVQISI